MPPLRVEGLAMSGRLYVYDEKKKCLVQVGGDWKPTSRRQAVNRYVEDERLYGKSGVAPGTNVRIDSRTKHRRYMRENNLSTADDWTETWAKAEKERARIRAFGTDETVTSGYECKPDRARREAVERAWYEHTEKRRRK